MMPQGVILSKPATEDLIEMPTLPHPLSWLLPPFLELPLNGHLSISPHTVSGSLMFLLPYLSFFIKTQNLMISIIFGSPSLR